MANPSYITVVIETSEDDLGVTAKLAPSYPITDSRSLASVAAYIESLAAQQPLGRVLVLCTTKTSAHTAAGYWECTSAPADGDIVTLFGLTFTFKTTPATNPVNAFEILIGTASATMTNLTTAINANLFLKNVVTAVQSNPSGSTYRCTVTTTIAGAWGNTVPQLAKTSSNITLVAMTGGFTGGIANAGQGAHLSVKGLLT